MSPLTLSEIYRSFNSRDLEKGKKYHEHGHVENFYSDSEKAIIQADVRGTAHKPYAVSISMRRHRQGARILGGSCSCPVGYDCKHVVATLLEYVERLQRASPTLPGLLSQTPMSETETRLVEGWLRMLDAASDTSEFKAPATAERILYVVETRSHRTLPFSAVIAGQEAYGSYRKARPCDIMTLNVKGAPYLQDADVPIVTLLQFLQGKDHLDARYARIIESLLEQLFASERLHADDIYSPALRAGAPRSSRLSWRLDESGKQLLTIEPPTPKSCVFAAATPWYIDMETREAGVLTLDTPPNLLKPLLLAPPLSPTQAAYVSTKLQKRGMPTPASLPQIAQNVQVLHEAPTPILRLLTRELLPGEQQPYSSRSPHGGSLVDEAQLTFAYGQTVISPYAAERELTSTQDATIVKRPRDLAAEQKAFSRLVELALQKSYAYAPYGQKVPCALFYLPNPERSWLPFLHYSVPELRRQGWRVEIDPSFRHKILEIDDEQTWEAELVENKLGWFDCEVGIQVEGEKVSLLPLLLRMLREERQDIELLLAGNKPESRIFVQTAKGALALPIERVRTILETFLEILDPQDSGDAVPALPLARAATLQNEDGDESMLRWKTSERLAELGRKLKSFAGIAPVEIPNALQATLRPYQHEGVSWLQFLREYGFAGILADDMGLGKTMQTLTHILIEKEAGRLKHPALLIVPTSLVHNWLDEAARFTPSLSTLSLHGPERAERFGAIAQSDLVLTTYPLLMRDDILTQTPWHIVVLDEAQTVKNPDSKGAQAVRLLQAEHRLCLTGTPIENHLGELWAQFDFLMPGTLGNRQRFTRLFRTPIEQRDDQQRRASLSRRVRPFILRRTKDEVAHELPPKNEIVRRVELANDQRDLYETIRLAMHQRVLEEVAKKGFARSRIVILDALLKLRQVCCDPRLVKVPNARKVKSSAKLAELREMLPQLIEEGRRILIFSQFTSMLDLVEPELEKLNLPYVQIRGATADRRTPVKRFQAGEAPIFLISLKAGGTGLNLTAADTVIHLDPWWNPAVERQATDRAHRIGQTKNVFVYKLIASGTVEERILEMQERKAAIAECLFSENPDAKLTLEAEDLESLFAPIEE